MTISKKHHYVPRFHLKNFCIDNIEKIYCYDKLKDKSFIVKIEDIAQENLFYGINGLITDEIEKAISRVESKFFVPSYNEFIHVKNFKKVSYNSKKWFFAFLAFQMQRTSLTRLGIKDNFKKISLEIQKDKLSPILKQEIDYTLKNIDNPDYIKALHLDLLLPPNNELFSIAKHFFNKTWVILQNKSTTSLWTSDNPLSFYNSYTYEGNLGIKSKGVEIRFPLMKNSLLYSYDPLTDPPKSNKDKMSEEEVNFANICQLKSSVRFIFSFENNLNIASEYLKKYPKYKDPKRSRSKVITNGDLTELIYTELSD
jgi:Protein of unknown function (DUF4238)